MQEGWKENYLKKNYKLLKRNKRKERFTQIEKIIDCFSVTYDLLK